jgi:hypothetical protein
VASDVLSNQDIRLNVQGRHLDAARLYEARGRWCAAEPLYRSDFSWVRCLSGANHPVTLNSATNLARVYEAMGRHNEAETIRSRARGEFFEFCSMKGF